MMIDPKNPIYWDVHVAQLVHFFQDKLCRLTAIDFTSFTAFERGKHQGKVIELSELIDRIHKEIYILHPNCDPAPVQLEDHDEDEDGDEHEHINVAFLVDIFQAKATQLIQTGPSNFPSDIERGYHHGRIEELTEVLDSIKRRLYYVSDTGNTYPPESNPYVTPVQLVDCPDHDNDEDHDEHRHHIHDADEPQNPPAPYIPPIDPGDSE